jgi:formate dehydrogenase subunit gamma
MAATTRPPDPPAGGPAGNPPGRPVAQRPEAGKTTAATATPSGSLLRFDAVERALHWVNAVLFGILIVTGAALYLQPIGEFFGRRALVEDIHVYSGLALPVPVILALCGSWGRALRADVRRFNRWTAEDRAWVRALTKPAPMRRRHLAAVRKGKFNAGQKLNAAFIAGSGLVMLGTGEIMRWYHPYPLSWRTGATFVHDWLALSIGIVVIGHIVMALRDPDALRSMFTGRISRRWAKRHAPAWVDGDDGDAPATGAATGRPSAPMPGPAPVPVSGPAPR